MVPIVREARPELLLANKLPYTKESWDIKELKKSTRDWALRIMPPYVEKARENFYRHMATEGRIPLKFPHKFMTEAAPMGLLGMTIPAKDYGGSEMNPLEQIAAIEALAEVDAGLALKILVQNTLAAWPIVKHGTIEQKKKYLKLMAKGETIGCIGLSEPGVGSDLMNLKCSAEWIEGVGWKINGEKTWITSANGANFMVLAARTGKPGSGAKGISTFIVPFDRNSNKLEIKTIAKHGQHASQFCSVAFKDYIIPADALLGIEHEGQQVLRDTLNLSRIWIAAQGTGVAMHAYEEAVKRSDLRGMYDGKLSDLPLNQRNLDHMKREIDIARLLVRKAAWAEQNKNRYAHVWASLAKVVAGEVAFLASHDAQLIFGATGYIMEAEPGFIAADADPIRIYEGAREVQVDLLLKYLTEKQLELVWPRADHPIKEVKKLPSAEKVITEVEKWIIKRREPSKINLFLSSALRFLANMKKNR